MSRGKIDARKPLEPDVIYKSKVVSKLIKVLMYDGKKSIAEKIVYDTIEGLNPDDPKEARKYFEDAVKNVMPEMEVRTRRVGGANYQIPIPLKHERAETLGLRWIVDSARSSKGRDMTSKLINEIKLAHQNEGNAMKKKVDTHKMAEANRAFAHFKW